MATPVSLTACTTETHNQETDMAHISIHNITYNLPKDLSA
jgi:hypothetical protein